MGVKWDGVELMAVSAWSEVVPSGQSLVGVFPTYARSVWNAISQGMSREHFWSGTGGGSDASCGDLLPGASRAYVGVQSASSAPNSQMTGRAFLASNVSRLFIYDSTGTYLTGTSFFDECATTPGNGYWLRQTGRFVVSSSGTTTTNFPITYSTTPTVYLTVFPDAGVQQRVNVGCIASTTGFDSSFSFIGGTSTLSAILWESFGTAPSSAY